MVGIFARFSSAGAHRRAKSAVVVETLAPNMNSGKSGPEAAPADSPHGIEVGVEFKPVEHPVEPVNLDQPVKCPLPEPSILHDGRIWKERMSTAGARAMTDLPVVKEGSQLESDSSGASSRSSVQKRAILPSKSEEKTRSLITGVHLLEHVVAKVFTKTAGVGLVVAESELAAAASEIAEQ
ncbi:hypothetical protein GUJ93_ZPchr0006g45229 [Zizania palustris]|uniref:Uncharacterized protein n=1 Tax=Zizania palustris TaxID=103762 RepID=A0A8J5T861_ZIZPA|nr:hypothetical protein GUJ93_ZPchr0006g45229 [Zizania palustris]